MAAVESGAQSIDRAAQILVRLMESDETVTLASVIEETRLPKTTAARLLRALERNGLRGRNPIRPLLQTRQLLRGPLRRARQHRQLDVTEPRVPEGFARHMI